MIDDIVDPVAYVDLEWVSAAQGGRASGPPTAAVYAATCLLGAHAEDGDVIPGWPGAADQLSILLQEVPGYAPHRTYKADFLARDLAEPLLHVGARVVVLEGPRIVAAGVVRRIGPDVSHSAVQARG